MIGWLWFLSICDIWERWKCWERPYCPPSTFVPPATLVSTRRPICPFTAQSGLLTTAPGLFLQASGSFHITHGTGRFYPESFFWCTQISLDLAIRISLGIIRTRAMQVARVIRSQVYLISKAIWKPKHIFSRKRLPGDPFMDPVNKCYI